MKGKNLQFVMVSNLQKVAPVCPVHCVGGLEVVLVISCMRCHPSRLLLVPRLKGMSPECLMQRVPESVSEPMSCCADMAG